MPYKNPKRKVGSQIESPSKRLNSKTNEMIVSGYQKFGLTNNGVVKFLGVNYDQKFRKIFDFLGHFVNIRVLLSSSDIRIPGLE